MKGIKCIAICTSAKRLQEKPIMPGSWSWTVLVTIPWKISFYYLRPHCVHVCLCVSLCICVLGDDSVIDLKQDVRYPRLISKLICELLWLSFMIHWWLHKTIEESKLGETFFSEVPAIVSMLALSWNEAWAHFWIKHCGQSKGVFWLPWTMWHCIPSKLATP